VYMRVEQREAKPGRAVVVLLHGLMSSDETWAKDGQDWRRLLLEDPDLPGVDVALVRYRTKFWNSRMARMGRLLLRKIGIGKTPTADDLLQQGDPVPIEDLAKLLWQELEGDRFAPYEQIVLVGHSMGGLVAMEYLLQVTARGHQHRVTGYVSIATPFDGSGWAFLKKAAPAYNQEQIAALMPNSGFIDGLTRRWGQYDREGKLAQVKFRFLYGQDDGVVDRKSAVPKTVSDLFDGAYAVEGGHNDVLLVASHQAKPYRFVKEHLVDALYAHPPPAQDKPRASGHEQHPVDQVAPRPASVPEVPNGGTKVAHRPVLFAPEAQRRMEQFVRRFPGALQGEVRAAADEVEGALAQMQAGAFDEFLTCYRHPFDATHGETVGVAEVWQMLTLVHLLDPQWQFATSEEVANLQLCSQNLWKRLVHSADRETMPEVLLSLARRRLAGPYGAEIQAGRHALFLHAVLVDNALPAPAYSVCKHCRPPELPPFAFSQLLRDFTQEEDAEVFAGVEPLSNTYQPLTGVEVSCTACIQAKAQRAGTIAELRDAIREVI